MATTGRAPLIAAASPGSSRQQFTFSVEQSSVPSASTPRKVKERAKGGGRDKFKTLDYEIVLGTVPGYKETICNSTPWVLFWLSFVFFIFTSIIGATYICHGITPLQRSGGLACLLLLVLQSALLALILIIAEAQDEQPIVDDIV